MAAAGYRIEMREGERAVPLSELEEVQASLQALDGDLECVGQIDAIVGILSNLLSHMENAYESHEVGWSIHMIHAREVGWSIHMIHARAGLQGCSQGFTYQMQMHADSPRMSVLNDAPLLTRFSLSGLSRSWISSI